MKRTDLTIGLFGFGCVGYGLHEVLQKTPTLKTRLKTICVKNKEKQRPISQDYFTYDPYDILNDPEINVVVELIDDSDAAFQIVSESLKRGKAVVTANKKMIAEHFDTLLDLQRAYNVPLLYEGACCASIPIIRNLEEYYDNDMLESIEGIVNGSTNYILTKAYNENLPFEEALLQAQENGFAESNPFLDISGLDAKYKLLILIAHAFGVLVKPDDIPHLGIDRIKDLELNYAKEKGLKIKLVANAFKNPDGSISAFVMPKFVAKSDKFYTVDDVFNGVLTKTSFADTQFFSGKGAGAHPTASAVLSDISAISYHYRYEYKKLNKNETLKSAEDIYLNVFLRHAANQQSLYAASFDQINERFSNYESGYIIGIISLSELIKIHRNHEDISFVLFENQPQISEREPSFLAELALS